MSSHLNSTQGVSLPLMKWYHKTLRGTETGLYNMSMFGHYRIDMLTIQRHAMPSGEEL